MKNFEDKKNIDAESLANKMFVDMLSKLILEADNAPEHTKLNVQILNATDSLNETLFKHIEKYVSPDNTCTDIELLTSILEYIKLVEAGINRFFDGIEGEKK